MKPILLCILDGWGLSTKEEGNGPLLALTPTIDYLTARYPNIQLHASGSHVGLPDGQMGNSEVGHLNIGCGRVVYTGLSLINKEIEEDQFKNRDEIEHIYRLLEEKKGKLHFLTLSSFGGVHSHLSHFFYLAKLSKEKGVPYSLHAFTDGRDVSPNQAIKDFKEITSCLSSTGGTLATISGRYYAMDRDNNWDRTVQAYRCITGQCIENKFINIEDYIQASYDANITDEFIKPAINANALDKTIQENDVIVFLNFRPDRARQMSHLLTGSTCFQYSEHQQVKNLSLFTMMKYDEINVVSTLLPPLKFKNTLGEVLFNNNIKQLRIAETEKYPHVTYFFDGAKKTDYPTCKNILIPSPKVATYDLQPEMSAVGVRDKAMEELPKNDVVILNFANPDMVGHTGSLTAVIKACEAIDFQVMKLFDKVQELSGTIIIVADHGNAEVMFDQDKQPHTAHTTNLVPFILCSDKYRLKDSGKLADIAPTILDLLDIEKPEEMNGDSLLIKK